MGYSCLEVNRAGRAISNTVRFRREGFNWSEGATGYEARFLPRGLLPRGGAPPPAMVVRVPWEGSAFPNGSPPTRQELLRAGLRVALCRAEFSGTGQRERGGVWSTWHDPLDEEVDFHRSECFGDLELVDRRGAARL